MYIIGDSRNLEYIFREMRKNINIFYLKKQKLQNKES